MKQQGFGLLEILISVVILSLGLLGVAALQTKSVGFNHSGELRSIAALQAYNMLDRIRTNKTGREEGLYSNITGLGTNPNCTACSSSQLAQLDQFQWNTMNATLLPQGQGTVVQNNNAFTVTIYWDNYRTGATGLNCSNDTSVDLSCLQITSEM